MLQTHKHIIANKHYYIVFAIIVLLNAISYFYFFRIDLTAEKRYTLSSNTKNLMTSMEQDLQVNVYLAGDLNMGFLRLQKSTNEMLREFSRYSNKPIQVNLINPSKASNEKARSLQYQAMEQQGMTPTIVNERDAEGKFIQKLVFPWAEMIYNGDTVQVHLLKNIPGKLGDENLHISIESLEYELTNGIRKLVQKEQAHRIAFIEGHGEFSDVQVLDITNGLAEYYFVDRGQLTDDVRILDPYKVIIIAGSVQRFTESEKFIIDQYIMNGGRVLWLIDGVRTSMEMLTQGATTIGIANDVNLDDQLFTYGIRIAPVLVSDLQSAFVRINIAAIGETPQFELLPWYYFPLLQTSPYHVVTKNISPIRAEFVSAIQFVGNNPSVKREVLLATGNASRVQPTPIQLSLSIANEQSDENAFDQSFIPVAAVMSGNFESVFTNRLMPRDVFVPTAYRMRNKSKPTKMIVVADADIIRNNVQVVGNDTVPLPLGFDRSMNKQFGNREFILNAVNYLADDEGWMDLRAREFTIRMLDKQAIDKHSVFLKIINLLLPFVMVVVLVLLYQWHRKIKYTSISKSDKK